MGNEGAGSDPESAARSGRLDAPTPTRPHHDALVLAGPRPGWRPTAATPVRLVYLAGDAAALSGESPTMTGEIMQI